MKNTMLYGIPVVIGEGRWEQYRFPRTRNRRIRRKWAQRFRNYRWVDDPAPSTAVFSDLPKARVGLSEAVLVLSSSFLELHRRMEEAVTILDLTLKADLSSISQLNQGFR